ncbi:unnamed protein product [Oncorhynchus mykiss]|uniref:Sleeping Beauty transposase HTH domain-containing protein n=1 Tax=Oncorhynchus mykiss TaxID=8022 RepID=A0A060XA17_ONCMY|nr:unnamed protein product [Oncorhynchus mykiss]
MEVYQWMPTSKRSASLLDIMGKSKEISQDLRKTIVDLHKSGSSLGAISKRLKVPRSSVKTIVRKYKHHGTTQLSYCSGRRSILSPRDERTLVQKWTMTPSILSKLWQNGLRTRKSRQEGVGIGFYSPLDVTINTDEGEVHLVGSTEDNFTVHQTSPPYKQVVFVLEQNKTGLPLDYIKKLEAVETNGYSGPSILDDITALKPADKGKSL